MPDFPAVRGPRPFALALGMVDPGRTYGSADDRSPLVSELAERTYSLDIEPQCVAVGICCLCYRAGDGMRKQTGQGNKNRADHISSGHPNAPQWDAAKSEKRRTCGRVSQSIRTTETDADGG